MMNVYFPPEILNNIFENLNERQLKPVAVANDLFRRIANGVLKGKQIKKLNEWSHPRFTLLRKSEAETERKKIMIIKNHSGYIVFLVKKDMFPWRSSQLISRGKGNEQRFFIKRGLESISLPQTATLMEIFSKISGNLTESDIFKPEDRPLRRTRMLFRVRI